MLRGEEIASQLSIWWGMKFQNHADHAIFVFCTDRSAHLFCEKFCNIKSETGGGFCDLNEKLNSGFGPNARVNSI